MRHRGGGPQNAGDDSFLDIVANIVGILIILIVVAGVRASRAPVSLADAETPNAVTTDHPEPPQLPDLRLPEPGLNWSSGSGRPPTDVIVPDETPAPVATAPAIEDRTDRVLEQYADLVALKQKLLKDRQRASQLRQKVDALEARARSLRETQRDGRHVLADVAARLTLRRQELTRLSKELAEMAAARDTAEEASQPKVVEIGHRLNPVGRAVKGAEQHFYVRDGKVTAIPFERLKQRVRGHMSRYGREMTRFPRHEGRVGPVDGFVMEYTVARRSVGVSDELRFGRGMVRIAVTHWTLRPEPDLAAESIDDALKRASRYQTVLRASDESTVLTYWVYPESFAGMRKLQADAHKSGFRVAARPLPRGIPISGSPDGSRSQAQ